MTSLAALHINVNWTGNAQTTHAVPGCPSAGFQIYGKRTAKWAIRRQV